MRSPVRFLSLGVAALACLSCASTPAKDPDALPTVTSIEVAELEISEVGVDRFTSCPPPGEIGDKWVPPIPAWTDAAASDSPSLTSVPEDNASSAVPVSLHDDRGRAERIIVETRADLRRCYQRGLFNDPTQDGHVALALRIDHDGKVAKVEAYGACDLSSEVLTCMKDVASGLHFAASGRGDTLVVPVVFSGHDPRRTSPTSVDAYTADAYVSLENARPALHVCAVQARKEGKAVSATATFTLDVDGQGKVTHAHVENWDGDRDVLTCAADALSAVSFPPPPAGSGRVMSRLAINPRLGTR